MGTFPEYGIINDTAELEKTFFGFLDDMNANVTNFVLTNKDKISAVYKYIKNGESWKRVNVPDLNIVFHSYKEYLADMLKYILSDEVESKLKQVTGDKKIELANALTKMREQDKKFFDTVVSQYNGSDSISNAMKNVEVLIEYTSFIKDVRKQFKELNDDKNLKFMQLYASSVSNFSDNLLQGIMNTLEVITATIDGTLAQSIPNKEVRYKMF